MALRDLRIAEAAWDAATPLRRAEWRAAIEDLLAESSLGPAFDAGYGLVSLGSEGVVFELLDDEGEIVAATLLELPRMAEHVREYLQIIHRMDSEGPIRDVAHLEALDMAKKVAHDRAARALEEALPEVGADLATYRKLFTLVLVLSVDTTTMTHARGHRRFR